MADVRIAPEADASIQSSATADAATDDRVFRKVFRRLIWFLFILLVVSFMGSLYGIRALVGAAEAGFLPGMLLYLTYWFPATCRARANALFIMGIPATIAIGSTVSGVFLQMDGFLGLAGWRH